MSGLWPHQVRAMRQVLNRLTANNGGAAIEARMGGGKTRAALAALQAVGAERIIVVAPKTVAADVWPRECEAFGGPWPVVDLASGTGAKRAALAATLRGSWLAAMNYEALLIGPLREALIHASPDAIVFDEIHRVSNHVGAQMREARTLAAFCPFKLGLTGTPFSNSRGPLGLWAYYQCLAPDLMPSRFTAFRSYITQACSRPESSGARPVSRDGRLEYYRYRNLDWHKRAWQRLAWVVPEAPQVDALPPPIDIVRQVVLEPKAKKIYRQLERQHAVSLETGELLTAPNVLARMTRLQQLTGGHFVNDDGPQGIMSTAKRSALEDILKDVSEPVVVFARFRHEIEEVWTACDAADRPCYELSGRANNLEAWRRQCRSDRLPVLAVQIQSGSEGISLTEASLAVFWSTTYSRLTFDQARARLQRPGQRHQVRFVTLEASNTIDEAIAEALRQRLDFVQALSKGIVQWPRLA